MFSKTVAIWGATGSIGLELVKNFLCRSWWVVAFGRSLNRERFIAKVASSCDKGIERLCYKRIQDFGRIDIDEIVESCGAPWQLPQLHVNAAGLCFYGSFLSATSEDFVEIVKSNLGVSFHILKNMCNVARHFPRMPFLYVEIGSRAGESVDHPNFSLYAMAKQGQVGLLHSLAAEMEGTQCSFLILSPGGVQSSICENSLGDRDSLRIKFANNLNLPTAAQMANIVVENVECWIANEIPSRFGYMKI